MNKFFEVKQINTAEADLGAVPVYVGQRVLVGLAGYNELEYGVILEDLHADYRADEPTWGCDLFFRNPAFEEYDSFGYLFMEESQESCAQFSTPQAAVDYARGSLSGMMQHLQDAGYLNLNSSRGDSLTIFKADPALVG